MVIPFSPLPKAYAAKITVPTDFPTIQDAIDAASDGDTIQVLKGSYTEQLTINKSLTLIGAGAKSTIINAPAVLDTDVLGHTYIVGINNAAKVAMKGFTINGPAGTSCVDLVGFSVQQDSTLKLDSSAIKGCTQNAVWVGAPPFIPGGPQVGHASISKTFVTDYRDHGLFALGSETTLTVTRSEVVGVAEESVGQIGILVVDGAKGIILNNKVSGNICNNPACGPDYLSQFQAFGIAVESGTISNNDVSNNDVGVTVFGSGGINDKLDHNKLKDNRFFGMIVDGGNHKSVHDKISGGNVGIAVVAIFADTTATLVHDKITGAETPTQKIECCGFTAEIVTIPSNSFQSSQIKAAQASEVGPDFLKKKFGLEEPTSVSSLPVNPF